MKYPFINGKEGDEKEYNILSHNVYMVHVILECINMGNL